MPRVTTARALAFGWDCGAQRRPNSKPECARSSNTTVEKSWHYYTFYFQAQNLLPLQTGFVALCMGSKPAKVALSLPALACTQDVKDSSWVDTPRDLVPIALVEV
jgi:hypothetical protein